MGSTSAATCSNLKNITLIFFKFAWQNKMAAGGKRKLRKKMDPADWQYRKDWFRSNKTIYVLSNTINHLWINAELKAGYHFYMLQWLSLIVRGWGKSQQTLIFY